MKIAILSAGPSLRQTFDPGERFDLRIAVNAAAAVFCCDWWSCGDGQTFARMEPVGFPVLFTMDPGDGHYRQRRETQERLAKHRVVAWSDLRQRLQPPACWTNWSLTAAMALAADQGATRVEIYGHDRTGTVDVNGFRLDKRAELWPRVNGDVEAMAAWLNERGVRVRERRPERSVA